MDKIHKLARLKSSLKHVIAVVNIKILKNKWLVGTKETNKK